MVRGRVVGYARDTGLVFIYDPSPPWVHPRATDGKVVVLKEPFRALVADAPLSASPRTGRVRPLMAGVSIGNARITAGTLGWFGRLDGEIVIISNAHVLTDRPESPNPPVNPVIVQPGPIDGGILFRDRVAYYHSHVPIEVIGESDCPVANLFVSSLNWLLERLGRKTRLRAVVEPRNKVDVALATLDKGVEYIPAVMGDDGNPVKTSSKFVGLLFAGSGEYYIVSKASNILTYYPGLRLIGATPAEVKVGDRVVKCGRTTGCTEGEVVSTNAVVRVLYATGEAVFEDVIVVKGKSAGGDSGSSVWLLQ